MTTPGHDRPWATAAFIGLTTRIATFAAGYLAVLAIGITPPPVEPAVWRVYRNELLNLPARWDAFWYYTIATDGYHWSGNTFDQQSVVFFPLYPWLMRVGGAIAGGHALLAGVAISLVAFLVALVYVYRLARLDLPADQARMAVALLACYPFAVFYGAAYTEAVFLLEAVAAFYYVRRDQPAKAAVAACLAGMTRPHGCVLALPLGWLAWQREPRDMRRLAVAAMPIVGVLLYSTFLWIRFGQPLIWISNQVAWGLTFVPHQKPEPLVGPHLATPVASAIVLVANIVAIAGAAATIPNVFKRFGGPYALFVLVYITPAFLAHAFTSAGRFTSVVFPVFFVLAARIRPAHRPHWIAAFAAGQLAAAMLFYSWRPLV